MNNFEETFFNKYVPEWQEVIEVFHRHWIKIIDDIILAIWLGVLIPVFLYYNSLFLQTQIEFIYLELYLFLVYIVIIYKILDWYNDVLILTNNSVIKLEWSLFKTKMQTTDYEHIEWVEVDKKWVFDTILKKWDLIIHKFWDEEVILDQASKPYEIVNKIEEITSEIDHPEENDRFDLMMDALWWMVQNYLWEKEKKKEDVFEDDIMSYKEEIKTNNKKSKQINKNLQGELLEDIENKDGTIDLR